VSDGEALPEELEDQELAMVLGEFQRDPDTEDLVKLALAGCGNADIAVLIGCSEPKLRKRYGQLLAKARATRRKRILDQQDAAARKGNASVLIWLGKVELDQVDKKPRPDPVNAYLEAMDAASAKHDETNSPSPYACEE
jgi:hypothetical protein